MLYMMGGDLGNMVYDGGDFKLKVAEKSVKHMEKLECVSDYEKQNLVMSEEKCNDCPYLYECRFMAAEMTDVVDCG